MTPAHTLEWSVIRLSGIEDLSQAVHGAGLGATQMSSARVTGSLAFAESSSIRFTTGTIDSRVSLTGPLSEDKITLGLGIDLPPGTRHWLNDVTSGSVGVFMPGDEHDSLYMPGSLYAVFTLSGEVLEEVAAEREIVLTSAELGGSGVHGRHLSAPQLARIKTLFKAVHDQSVNHAPERVDPGQYLVDALIDHIGRSPRASIGIVDPRGYERIVRHARDFIHENLGSSLSVELIAAAASTSPRTLHRAFKTMLDETPYSYVLKLRLHRIRYDIISDAEQVMTLTSIANSWGISELGRLSGWYRDLFGELPSVTRRKLRQDCNF